MPKAEETLWTAWCPLCHRIVAEAGEQVVVRAAWFVHAEEAHPSENVLKEVS
jgi:hypothetical protein